MSTDNNLYIFGRVIECRTWKLLFDNYFIPLNKDIKEKLAKNVKMLTSAKLIFWITFDWFNFRCWNFAQSLSVSIGTIWIKNNFRNFDDVSRNQQKWIFVKKCWHKQNFRNFFNLKCAHRYCPAFGKISLSKVKPIKSYSKNKFC